MSISIRNVFSASFFVWLTAAILGLCYLFTISDGKIALRQDRLKFGIDLVGGTYITLEVQTDKALEIELIDKGQNILKRMKDAHIALPIAQLQEKDTLIWKFETINQVYDAAQFIKNDPSFVTKSDQQELRIQFKESAAHKIKEWAVQGNIEVLRTRLDRLGVGEIHIASQGEKNIVIDLPNVDNPQKARAMIGKPALLEVKLVERSSGSKEDILDAYDGELPEGMEILPGKPGADGFARQYYLVPRYTDLTGRLLKDAYAGFAENTQSGVVVHFKFNPEGGEKFYELTRKNYNRQIALILDGEVISAPRISVPISTEGYIHGDFTTETAHELALLLKSGAFVAPVSFEEERQIGPSLGQESIRQGLIACLVGLILLFIFSILFYKVAGFYAFVTLLYNLLIIMLALSWLHATLTLPGIAGMVLTLGMAIDASILIYEKIKEELSRGVTLKKAVDVGFSDAMTVILDSNITTFLVGIVLYKFGTGPIQGFAVTMMVGIIATLVTGLFFLRSLFNFTLYNLDVQKLKI